MGLRAVADLSLPSPKPVPIASLRPAHVLHRAPKLSRVYLDQPFPSAPVHSATTACALPPQAPSDSAAAGVDVKLPSSLTYVGSGVYSQYAGVADGL